jgi:hypothetical protein
MGIYTGLSVRIFTSSLRKYWTDLHKIQYLLFTQKADDGLCLHWPYATHALLEANIVVHWFSQEWRIKDCISDTEYRSYYLTSDNGKSFLALQYDIGTAL